MGLLLVLVVTAVANDQNNNYRARRFLADGVVLEVDIPPALPKVEIGQLGPDYTSDFGPASGAAAIKRENVEIKNAVEEGEQIIEDNQDGSKTYVDEPILPAISEENLGEIV